MSSGFLFFLAAAIDRLVLLGGAPNGAAEKLKSSSLFIVARDDSSGDGPRLPRIQEQYKKLLNQRH